MEQHSFPYAKVEAWVMEYYRRHGRRTDFLTALKALSEEAAHPSAASEEAKASYLPPAAPSLPDRHIWQTLSRPDFFDVLLRLPIHMPFWEGPFVRGAIFAESIMPTELMVYALRYVRDIVEQLHIHNFFEVNYVLSGSCRMAFEEEVRTLAEGQLCILAPGSRHDLTVSDDSQVVSLMFRQTTFDTAFFNLMAQDDLLGSFLRGILSGDAAPNYLLFTTDNSDELFRAIRDIFMECHLADHYSNTCVISRIHLLFGILLRDYGSTIQLYEGLHTSKNSRGISHQGIPALLQYIQNHYQTITLEALAETFHYNPSYLSRLIKKNTGRTLVEILTHLKLSHASYLLSHTSLPVSDTARLVGYDSADHFSRQFRRQFGMPPREYRQKER